MNTPREYQGPACGCSPCRQNYIDTGETECVAETCADCGEPLDEAGDGYDGRCADCADAYDDDEPDTDEGPWSGPGDRTFNEGPY